MARNQAADPLHPGGVGVQGLRDAERAAQVLRHTLRKVGRITQGRTADIAALARAVRRCLGTPADLVAMQDARQLVELMHANAHELGNFVNCAAEERGCNFVESRA